MAKEWYLLKSPHDQVSGFESDALLDFGEEGFLEVLDSELADDVEILNYDLSISIPQRVVIQNNTQDTKLKTFQRAMFAPIGTCKAGMYVKYRDRYWLIVGIVDNNKVYEKAILLICNYKLSWIDASGKLIQRWVNAESASQYNNGESNMAFYFVRSDQLMVYLPDDEDSLMLNSGMRFIIDKRCEIYEKSFDENTTKDTSNQVIVYICTRSDTVLDNYTDSGIIGFIFTQTEQRENDGYYVIGDVGCWLCDLPNGIPENNSSTSSFAIQCDSDIIYIDLEPGIFTAKFYDDDGNEINESLPDFSFEVISDFDSSLDTEIVNQSILIGTSNSKLNGKSFTLKLQVDGYEAITKSIQIREFL